MCQRSKTTTRPSKALMQNILPEKPGELLSVDFYGPLPTSTGGVKHIFVTTDAFSKLVCLYPIKRATTTIIIKKIFSHYYEKYGKPEKIICDHCTQFTAKTYLFTYQTPSRKYCGACQPRIVKVFPNSNFSRFN